MSDAFIDVSGDDDTLHEECGVFGIYGHPEAASLTAFGLHALQHRGQEATGIVASDGTTFNAHRAMEMVGKAYGDPAIMARLAGHIAIGHNRYATAGGSSASNIQPLYADLAFGGLAIAHNGNLTNAQTLRRALVQKGALFQSSSDTEVIVHLMALSAQKDPAARLIDALRQIKGAYSLVACTNEMVMAMRDPHGVRPLVLGYLDGTYVAASESCALDIIGAAYIRDIEPGELVIIDENGLRSQRPFDKDNGRTAPRFCIFEYIYFARPDSYMGGHSVYEVRKNIGAELAREAPCDAELVVPVPDSGVPAAIGYTQQSGLPFELGIIRSHYVGRTFIQPTDNIRSLGVRMKHNANQALIKGKRIVLVDDSIVRGTTSKKIVTMMRETGAAEVHMRVSSPPSRHSCFYGIDTPATEDLIAHNMSPDEIAAFIGADSVSYISLNGLYRALGETKRDADQPQYCDACFSGDYAIELTDHDGENSGHKNITDISEHKGKKA